MIRLQHTGDLGDLIAGLPVLRALSGGEIVLTEPLPGRKGPRESLRGQRYETILPLLCVQDYVFDCEWQDKPLAITHDLSHFREMKELKNENLADWQARYLGVKISLEPWLTVPETNPNGQVIFARSRRYHNFFFPWDELCRKHKDAIFVGLPAEHEALEAETERKIKYHPTKDLLELAELIAGAKLVISNQSCAFWVACGLGVPVIQETWEPGANSIVERPNAIYTPTAQETRTLMLRHFANKSLVATLSEATRI